MNSYHKLQLNCVMHTPEFIYPEYMVLDTHYIGEFVIKGFQNGSHFQVFFWANTHPDMKIYRAAHLKYFLLRTYFILQPHLSRSSANQESVKYVFFFISVRTILRSLPTARGVRGGVAEGQAGEGRGAKERQLYLISTAHTANLLAATATAPATTVTETTTTIVAVGGRANTEVEGTETLASSFFTLNNHYSSTSLSKCMYMFNGCFLKLAVWLREV